MLVIDDNSPDGTGRSPTSWRLPTDTSASCIAPVKEGLGTAISAGFRDAISHGYDYVLNMDADFSHDPQYLPAIVDADAESRRRPLARGTSPEAASKAGASCRHFMSRGINWYARLLLRLCRRATIAALIAVIACQSSRRSIFDRVRAHGYAFQEEDPLSLPPRRLPLRGDADRVSRSPLRRRRRSTGASRLSRLWIIFRLSLEKSRNDSSPA